MTSGTELVRRATVESIVANRDLALALYAEAHAALAIASGAVLDAWKAEQRAAPLKNRYNYDLDAEKCQFHFNVKVPDHDEYMATARRIVDTDTWAHIVEITDLQMLMDKKAKDQLRQQLIKEPPEVTVENVCATLETFAADAGTIFKRGIAECFSNLDRRFKSHDGWKIGSRIILDHAFDEWGSWSYYRNQRDAIIDVERVFSILDGNRPSYCAILSVLEKARGRGHGRRRTEVESDYFVLRCFKNGNCHIWFKRDDLVEKVNQLLGEYYGAAIPEEREDEENPLATPKTALAKRYGFYPTPDPAVGFVMTDVPLYAAKSDPPLTILEPSAGTGQLARACLRAPDGEYSREHQRWDHHVDCIEVQPDLAAGLRAEGIYRRVYCGDFLAITPDATGLYDMVVMNPPFDRERDIDHVMHAMDFLKPGGHLTAIMSAGTEFRDTKKAIAFRALMKKMGARWTDLPAGSFSSVGTNCNTIRLMVRKY